ncbi:hypothetical protein GCM10010313_70540 [Streptomyces violarus]|uniref:Uncharacterized protein n=1 Tax=Streptomyces violarus TaxID=67380 RepID=A0A7W5F5U0_9ACTN|nr:MULTISPECIES: hypothetical protein [Streptomyces]MBB3080973.1 hypothetical protein [Streptomyces violarus]WRU02909.1 hypothetical protein VJ737_36790 [Streptomyces sp. CGMCC 4.1772]GHD29104.1 hypothetical protein GCM10010313_70540 [Streptomyces violarus]
MRTSILRTWCFEAPARGPLPAPPEHDALDQAMRRSGPADLTEPEPDKSS